MSSEIKLNPVGRVVVDNGRFSLSIDKEYRKALKELAGFSHINIIWWADRSASPDTGGTLVTEKPYRDGPDTVGIFATRSPVRPNPVLLSVASVMSIDEDEGIIDLGWIDADDGSPVIDMKPYHPSSDRVRDVRLPRWCETWPDCYEESGSFDWSTVFNF